MAGIAAPSQRQQRRTLRSSDHCDPQKRSHYVRRKVSSYEETIVHFASERTFVHNNFSFRRSVPIARGHFNAIAVIIANNGNSPQKSQTVIQTGKLAVVGSAKIEKRIFCEKRRTRLRVIFYVLITKHEVTIPCPTSSDPTRTGYRVHPWTIPFIRAEAEPRGSRAPQVSVSKVVGCRAKPGVVGERGRLNSR